MKTANYDFILPFFTSSDSLRPAMTQIHLDENGWVYATDAHILIKVPSELCRLSYKAIDKFPNAEAMFNRFQMPERSYITTNQLIDVLSAYKWVRECETELCTKCDGEGVITCEHCDGESVCKTCKGDGEKVIGISSCSLLRSNNNETVVKIANRLFKVDFIHVLAICAKVIGADIFSFTYNENEGDPFIFQVGNAQILIMPRLKSGFEEDVREIRINPKA